MPFDVFISHASQDRTIANAVCARLESAGIRCWIAPRDIVAGTSYGEAIIEAIHSAKVMVLVFSSYANASGHIAKEVERAVSNGAVVLPFRIEDVAPGKSLDYFIGSIHWLDAMTPPMEEHLDDLAETVRRLVPLTPDTQGTDWTAAPAMRTQELHSSAGQPARRKTVRPTPSIERESAFSARTLGIWTLAALVLIAIVVGVMLLRPKPVVTPQPVIPTVNSSPVQPIISGTTNPTNGETGIDPIVGCYVWFNNGQVVIHANGSIVGGPFTGTWKVVDAGRRAYAFTWPEAIDTITVSPDQRSLSGANQYGYPISARRTAGNVGLAGTWTMSNGVPIIVTSDGEFSSATFNGTWRAMDASGEKYSMTWPSPIDSVTLSADGSQIFGMNQYGVKISGTRTGFCTGG